MTETTASSRFVGDRPRTALVKLDWPVELGGRVYSAIGLRRLTAREVAEFVEAMQEAAKAQQATAPRAPIFMTEDGGPVPDALFDALDDDDALRLDEAAADFLPRRFREIEAALSRKDGSDTELTS